MTKPAPKKPRKPIYLKVERLIRPNTGEEVKAFVAMTQWDARIMKERKMRTGDEVRVFFTKRRNVKFHRLAHAIGSLLVDNIEGFENLSSHDALKRVQRECGAMCEESEIELEGYGKVVARMARSIAFDEMSEDEFSELFEAVTKYIDAHYADGLCDAVREEYDLMVVGNAMLNEHSVDGLQFKPNEIEEHDDVD